MGCNCRGCVIGWHVLTMYGQKSYNTWEFMVSDIECKIRDDEFNLLYKVIDILMYNRKFLWLLHKLRMLG